MLLDHLMQPTGNEGREFSLCAEHRPSGFTKVQLDQQW